MSANVRCDLSDLLEDECAHCTGADLPGELAVAASGKFVIQKATRTAEAAHFSRCHADPQHAIVPGDQIGTVDGFWLCSRCFA